MNYRRHYYCSVCKKLYRRDDFAKAKIPLCLECGKMLRRGPRKKNDAIVKRIIVEVEE